MQWIHSCLISIIPGGDIWDRLHTAELQHGGRQGTWAMGAKAIDSALLLLMIGMLGCVTRSLSCDLLAWGGSRPCDVANLMRGVRPGIREGQMLSSALPALLGLVMMLVAQHGIQGWALGMRLATA